jgi:hypothetical protein
MTFDDNDNNVTIADLADNDEIVILFLMFILYRHSLLYLICLLKRHLVKSSQGS